MGFYLSEHNGTWSVSTGVDNFPIGGELIDYATYQKLKDKPHEASKLFKRDKSSKIVKR